MVVPPAAGMEYWNIGMVEYWNDGRIAGDFAPEEWISPLFQHSANPLFQLKMTAGAFLS
jgi:hypothetical protein